MAETSKSKEKAASGATEDKSKVEESAQESTASLVEVEILDPMTKGAVAPDGSLFSRATELDPAGTNVVSEKYFEEVLADAVDSEGNKMFGKVGE